MFEIIGIIVVWIIGGMLSMVIPFLVASKLFEGLAGVAVGYRFSQIGLGLYILGTIIILAVT